MGTVYACEQRRAVSAEEENLRGARGNILISDEKTSNLAKHFKGRHPDLFRKSKVIEFLFAITVCHVMPEYAYVPSSTQASTLSQLLPRANK